MHKITGLFRLFRFELPFSAGVCVILGELLALGRFPAFWDAALAFLSVFCISAAALILNDYFDLESDRVNAPGRPLPSGQVTPYEVVGLFLVVSALGFVASFPLGPAALSVAIVVWAVGFLYNGRFKKTGLPGNLMVSFSVGMTFLFGGIAAGRPFSKENWLFAVLAFLINLGEEISADVMDLAGDQKAGSRSLPALLGDKTTLKISAALFGLVCVLSVVPFALGWIEWLYFPPILLMDVIILYSTARLLDQKLGQQRRRYIRWIYLSALLAILIFIVMRLVW